MAQISLYLFAYSGVELQFISVGQETTYSAPDGRCEIRPARQLAAAMVRYFYLRNCERCLKVCDLCSYVTTNDFKAPNSTDAEEDDRRMEAVLEGKEMADQQVQAPPHFIQKSQRRPFLQLKIPTGWDEADANNQVRKIADGVETINLLKVGCVTTFDYRMYHFRFKFDTFIIKLGVFIKPIVRTKYSI